MPGHSGGCVGISEGLLEDLAGLRDMSWRLGTAYRHGRGCFDDEESRARRSGRPACRRNGETLVIELFPRTIRIWPKGDQGKSVFVPYAALYELGLKLAARRKS